MKPFEAMTEAEQEQALRELLRCMNSEQLKHALSIAREFVLADTVERMCVEARESGYEPVTERDVKNTVEEVRSFLEGREAN